MAELAAQSWIVRGRLTYVVLAREAGELLLRSKQAASVVGAPTTDAERLAAWSHWIQLQFDGPTLAEHRAEVERACEELYTYLDCWSHTGAPSPATICSRP